MLMQEYETAAKRTRTYTHLTIYAALGLASEAGEVAGKVKKMLRDNHGEMSDLIREQIISELGDCLWYIANLAVDIGSSLDEVARKNIEKLSGRQERGVIAGSGDNR